MGNCNACKGGRRGIKKGKSNNIGKRRSTGGLRVKGGYVFTGSKYIPVKQWKHYIKKGY